MLTLHKAKSFGTGIISQDDQMAARFYTKTWTTSTGEDIT